MPLIGISTLLRLRPHKTNPSEVIMIFVNRPRALLIAMAIVTILSGCATQNGRYGAGVGALTGGTAGILLDPHNPWRGAAIGGSLGGLLGGALTDRPNYYSNYQSRGYYQQPYYPSYSYNQYRREATYRGAAYGGVAGAAAGAMLDHGNRWRGSLIGGTLGSIFGGGINFINSSTMIPVLQP